MKINEGERWRTVERYFLSSSVFAGVKRTDTECCSSPYRQFHAPADRLRRRTSRELRMILRLSDDGLRGKGIVSRELVHLAFGPNGHKKELGKIGDFR
jgi:hypothetical protein